MNRISSVELFFRRSRFHIQPLPTSTVKTNDHQFYPDNSVLSQLFYTTSQNPTINSPDEIHVTGNDKVSIVSGPKNVKFLIPFARSGLTSNESTLGIIESTTRTITHVKDIFPLNPSSQSQTPTNNETHPITPSSSSNSVTTASMFDTEHRQKITKHDSEEIPLLSSDK